MATVIVFYNSSTVLNMLKLLEIIEFRPVTIETHLLEHDCVR